MSATAYEVTVAYKMALLAMIAGFSILDLIAIAFCVWIHKFFKEEVQEN